MLGQHLHQLQVDALAKTFDIDGVNQEFVALGRQLRQRGGIKLHRGEFLPAVSDDPVTAVANASAEIEDELVAADPTEQFIESRLIELAVLEDR